MRSSLPEIYKKDIAALYKPEKQSLQFSLYLKTNNFRSRQENGQNRYGSSLNSKKNLLFDNSFSLQKQQKVIAEMEKKQNLKNQNSQKKNLRSRSLFIEEKQNQQIQQIDSFKTIRKRVLDELKILEKSIQIVEKVQKQVRAGFESYKSEKIDQLNNFQVQMKQKINNLTKQLKIFKKLANTEIKINKQQLSFINQQIINYKEIYQNFETKSTRLGFDIINTIQNGQNY